jgi:hypothetical protein
MAKIFNREVRIFTNSSTSLYVNGVKVLDKLGALLTGLPAATVTGAKLTTKAGYFTVAVKTNGTTAVNVFGAGGAPVALTVTSVKTVSQDTSAANITLAQAANTVVTIAKGTASGGVVGGVSLAHTVYAAGDVFTVVSDGAHDAIVEITFQVA